MPGNQSPALFSPDAYDVIAAAMNESERGRWFLDEHARRNRGPDTQTLLGAIARLEHAVTGQRGPDDVGHLRGDLLDMVNAISRTRAEIGAISAADTEQSRLGVASEALDAIVRTTERATSDILGAAEAVQETAWTLREHGIESAICDDLDRHATQIYTACSFQDLTAQRTGRIVHTLRYLEDRLNAMIAIWDTDADRIPPDPDRARGPVPAEPTDLCQSDIDLVIDTPPAPVAEPAATPLEAAPAAEAAATSIETAPAAMLFMAADDTIDFVLDAGLPTVEESELPAVEAVDSSTETAGPAEPVAAEEAVAAVQEPADAEPNMAAGRGTASADLGDIDLLSIEEKLALFS